MRNKLTAILPIVFSLILAGCTPASGGGSREIHHVEGGQILLTLYAFDANEESIFGVPNMGHSFIAVKNNTDEPLKVVNFPLEPGEEVTVGTYGHSARFGIWYNLEACYLTPEPQRYYRGIGSISREICAADLDAINKYLSDKDFWSFGYNCSAFALGAWNTVAGEFDAIEIKGTLTPAKVFEELQKFTGFELNRKAANTNSAYLYIDDEMQEWAFNG